MVYRICPVQAPQWWLSYLPLIYSLVSMLGVLLMSVCTPLGFSSLFTLLGAIITRPMVSQPVCMIHVHVVCVCFTLLHVPCSHYLNSSNQSLCTPGHVHFVCETMYCVYNESFRTVCLEGGTLFLWYALSASPPLPPPVDPWQRRGGLGAVEVGGGGRPT